jgi:plasmid stabilization system protein ParE
VPRALTVSPRAELDLHAIRLWLMQPGAGPIARRRLGAITQAIERLLEQPCLHAVGQHRGLRELSCGRGYRVIYRITPDTGRNETAGDVLILRIFGPGQSRDRL